MSCACWECASLLCISQIYQRVIVSFLLSKYDNNLGCFSCYFCTKTYPVGTHWTCLEANLSTNYLLTIPVKWTYVFLCMFTEQTLVTTTTNSTNARWYCGALRWHLQKEVVYWPLRCWSRLSRWHFDIYFLNFLPSTIHMKCHLISLKTYKINFRTSSLHICFMLLPLPLCGLEVSR